MKILFVQPYWSFLDLQNILFDKFTGYNLLACAKKGHEVGVLSYARGRRGVYYPNNEKICLHFADAFSLSAPPLIAEFPYFFHLEKTINRIHPDVIHINNLPFLTTLQATRIAKKLGIPSIVHVHGVIGKTSKLTDRAQYLYLNTLGQRVFHHATLLVCLTKSDINEIRKCGCPTEKIRLIPNGVDIEKFHPSGTETANLIFWGGRFIQQKGLEYLIDAFKSVAEKKNAARLVMTGTGPLFPKITGIVRKFGLQEKISFKGRVPRDELPGLINSASIYVLPSLKEGMPFALLEAMACGKAVIGSDIPGINDVITDGTDGIIVPPRDTRSLVDAILMLLNDPVLRRKLGQNARKLMVERYNWVNTHKKIEQLYDEVTRLNSNDFNNKHKLRLD